MGVQREIVGPQEQFERSGAQSLRDTRPFTTRLSEGLQSSASGIVLAVAAGATWYEPALVNLTVPASALYALWVLSRPPRLPLRLPWSSKRKDYGNPIPGTRKPRTANGSFFLGWSITGQELWITPDDQRQHMSIPGTTGAGKTTAILSMLTNALAQGSGFVFVDGKADRTLFGKVLALARRFGREDDVRVLNFMVASGIKDSHTFNPFAIGNADALRELLASQLGETASNDANGVFRERAVALMGTITPVLVWLRDTRGIPLNIEVIRFSIELRWIWKLAIEKVALLRDRETGNIRELDVSADIPEEIVWPLKSYLGELPGYDASLPLDKQKGDEPSKQHGYAQFYFTGIFAKLAVSLGHIFGVESGDIDMRDIVLNRRILVVNLPALENSEATLAALGKLVVASLRGMMAQLLGLSLEGGYTDDDKPGMGPSPFPVVLDELAYYATTGLDAMLSQGRGLNVSFMLGFQEVSGIWARLGERTASILGNANLTIAMRQQDSGRTREWIEKTAGQINVTQVSSYQGGQDGSYREARSAEVRSVSRVDWQDLTSLIEGEAIVLLGGRRVYARVFHAKFDETGPKRLGRTLMMREPDPTETRLRLKKADDLAKLIASGGLTMDGGMTEPSPVIAAIVAGMRKTAQAGGSIIDCADAALTEVSQLSPGNLPRAAEPVDGAPATVVSPMLQVASSQPIPGTFDGGRPSDPVNATLIRRLATVEELGGATAAAARNTAMRVLAERDEGTAKVIRIDPPLMTEAEFIARLQAIVERLRSLQGDEMRGEAA
ncbi:type IV secretory system conjugative DNA transfer family protein [Acidisoma silvae]|uniref:Type IV secretion system DNA-binding domain-containing protein n=1 Tax=Acidisoma silvae TaxID=2802396 RepID=A0A963YUV1_9PROT|nr:type IV secretion system DNA-binding domain-containing protein [Acidisoma silvae]MCB8877453.1 type IV secretion system DNA-binding domain-containing protein [Acidisoma silvae]